MGAAPRTAASFQRPPEGTDGAATRSRLRPSPAMAGVSFSCRKCARFIAMTTSPRAEKSRPQERQGHGEDIFNDKRGARRRFRMPRGWRRNHVIDLAPFDQPHSSFQSQCLSVHLARSSRADRNGNHRPKDLCAIRRGSAADTGNRPGPLRSMDHEFSMKGAGRIYALQDVNHVARSHTKGVQARHDV